MLSPRRHSQELEEHSTEYQTTSRYQPQLQHTATESIPRITVQPPSDNESLLHSDFAAESEIAMSSSSSSSHRSGVSSAKKSSKSRSKKDDWSDIADPEERRRVQNKLAQRKFRDRQKENRERDARIAENIAQARNAYRISDPSELPSPPSLPGLPWGTGFSMPFVISRGQAVAVESRHGSQSHTYSNERSHYSQDGHSPYQGLAENFDSQEYEGEEAYDETGLWDSHESQTQHYQYSGGDQYYHDDGGTHSYGGSS